MLVKNILKCHHSPGDLHVIISYKINNIILLFKFNLLFPKVL